MSMFTDKEKIECLEADIAFKKRRIKELEDELIETKSKLAYSRGLIAKLRGKSLTDPTLSECIEYLYKEELLGEVDYEYLMNELDDLYDYKLKYLNYEEEDDDEN